MTASPEDVANAWYNLGEARFLSGQRAESAAAFGNAGRLGNWAGHNNHGCVLMELGRPSEAVECFDKALALSPPLHESVFVHCNRGKALVDASRHEEADASFIEAIKLAPNSVNAKFSMGASALARGNFGVGWLLYEWRKAIDRSTSNIRPLPPWLGGRLEGRTVLVQAEQGLGDTIHFSRFALLAQKRGAKVILSVPDRLARLMRTLGPGISVLPESAPLPEFDGHAALMSLPLAFGYGGTCPVAVPYLAAEPEQIERWRERIGAHGFRIGICWKGSRLPACYSYSPARERSIPLRQFEALAKIPGVRLIGLQKGDGVEELAALPPGMVVETLGDGFDAGPDAFVDTAAAMMSLDLVITSDTAIAHLAGALGRPVWVVLPYLSEWRWLLNRTDSPWYPTMRLFRSRRPVEWEGVFDAIGAGLRAVAARGGTGYGIRPR
ncbi:MAG TPA: tetratricopeptide repeat-containing glycosyltransferase family protein [Rhizomicrobium sp.]|jgi:tetratricopeptide (TPR) repeat protein|nr:tetratricopeptide repeat-containing glycosyltransferase family protein [Rhizomicrobium sp.]